MRVGIDVPYAPQGYFGEDRLRRPPHGTSFLNCSVADCRFTFGEDGSLGVTRTQPDGTEEREVRTTTPPADRTFHQPGIATWDFDERPGTLTYSPGFRRKSPTATRMVVRREPGGRIDSVGFTEGDFGPPAVDGDTGSGSGYNMTASRTRPENRSGKGSLGDVRFDIMHHDPEYYELLDYGAAELLDDEELQASIIDGTYDRSEPKLSGTIDGMLYRDMSPEQLEERLAAVDLPPMVNPYNVVYDSDSPETATLSRNFTNNVTLLPDNSLQVVDAETGTVHLIPATPPQSADGASGPIEGTPLVREVAPDGTSDYLPSTTAPSLRLRRPGLPGGGGTEPAVPGTSQSQPGFGRWEFDEANDTIGYQSMPDSASARSDTTYVTVRRAPNGDIEKVELDSGFDPRPDPILDTLKGVPRSSYSTTSGPSGRDNVSFGSVDGVDFASTVVSQSEPLLNGSIDGLLEEQLTPDQLSDWFDGRGLPPTANPFNIQFDPDSPATASLSRLFDCSVVICPDNSLSVMDENGTVFLRPAEVAAAGTARGEPDSDGLGETVRPSDQQEGTWLVRVVMPDGSIEYQPTTETPTVRFRRPGPPGTSQSGVVPDGGGGGGDAPPGVGVPNMPSPDPRSPGSDSQPDDGAAAQDREPRGVAGQQAAAGAGDDADVGVSGGLVVGPDDVVRPRPDLDPASGSVPLRGGAAGEPPVPEVPTGLPPQPPEEGLGSNDVMDRDVPPFELELEEVLPADDRGLETALYPNGLAGPSFRSPLGRKEQVEPASSTLSLTAEDVRGMPDRQLTPEELREQARLAGVTGLTYVATGLALTPIPGDELLPAAGAFLLGRAAPTGAVAGVVPVVAGAPGAGGDDPAPAAAEDGGSSGPAVVDSANPVTEVDGDEVAVGLNGGGTRTYVDGGTQVYQGASIPDVGRYALVTGPGGEMSSVFVPVEPEPGRSGFGGAFVASPAPVAPEPPDEYVPTFAEDSFLGALTQLEEGGRSGPAVSAGDGSGFAASPALSGVDETGLLAALDGMGERSAGGSGYPECSVPGQVRCVDPDNNLVVGSGGAVRTDSAGRTVPRYDECSVPGQVLCLVPDSNQLRMGSDPARRQVTVDGLTVERERERVCGSAAEVGCVVPGSRNQLRVGTGAEVTTDGAGRTYEMADPVSPVGAYTPGYGEWAIEQITDPGPGAVSPPPAAGRVVETVVDAVQHPVETARNAWRGARQQAGRARDVVRSWWDGMPWNR